MGQSVEEVKTELEQLFSDKFAASPYFDMYCQIGAYLSSADNCQRELQRLNDEMQVILEHRLADIRVRIVKEVGGTIAQEALADLFGTLAGVRTNRFGTSLDAPQVSSLSKLAKELFSKLLSDVLGRWEHDNGFDVDHSWMLGGRRPADILIGNPKSLFNLQLESGRPFKDLGAGAQHGEFTHRIQWYLVGNALEGFKAGDLYKDIKRWISRGKLLSHQASLSSPTLFSTEEGHKRYLWEYLFDRDGEPSNAISVAFLARQGDFRGPSNLAAYLREPPHEAAFPLLTWCMRDRYTKRLHQAFDAAYMLKKAPKNSQLKELAKIFESGAQTEQDMAKMLAPIDGLFIRRGTFRVGVDWQKWPGK
ncbi:LirA/MavJ family T4SS effector [Pseudomonas citri]|uniref:LirA/MavJ family T4SS effector n=1 Tax=Pseudomonas citri TaxID=2978349 RepID=UPI0021B6D005|nr:LirA/MavJ family T4SS effector [Pseudomonas citri]